MSDETTLLSCPFCGGEAFVRIDTYFVANQARYRVGCDVDSYCHGYYGYSKYYTTEDEAIAAWNTRAHGTLTAEQVENAVKKYAHDDSCYIFEVYGEMCGPIADELNAAMGGGECELIYGETDNGVDSWFTQCGGRFNATFEDGRMVHPKYCQLCGKKAVER